MFVFVCAGARRVCDEAWFVCLCVRWDQFWAEESKCETIISISRKMRSEAAAGVMMDLGVRENGRSEMGCRSKSNLIIVRFCHKKGQ